MKKTLVTLLAVALCVGLCSGLTVAASDGALSMDSAVVAVGETFTVAVRVERNPGVSQLVLWVSYDPTVLQLTATSAADFSNIKFSTVKNANPVDVIWKGNGVTTSRTGTIAILTFRVIATAPCVTTLRADSSAALTLDKSGASASFAAAVGTVYVGTPMPGDANGDAAVNLRDVALLQRYLANWDVTVDTTAADVYRDDKVNNRDLATIQRYISGWDVTLEGAYATDTAQVTLPAVGYDPDGRQRIAVSNAYTVGNTAFITLCNVSTRWITDEKATLTYTCYDASGKVLGATTITVGVLDTRSQKEKSYALAMPAGTAELRITTVKFSYWTEWA